jgi:cell division protein FtsX
MAYREQNPFADDFHVAPQDAPKFPSHTYQLDAEDTLQPHRWDVREWRKRTWALLIVGLIIIIVVIVVPVEVVKNNNRYPDYTPLNYTISDTCTYSLLLLYHF